MTDSTFYDKLGARLIGDEGEVKNGPRHVVYDDATGKPILPGTLVIGNATIGHGTNLCAGITNDEALLLLDNRMVDAVADLTRLFPWFAAASENRRLGLANVAFAIGLTRFLGFKKALAAAACGDWGACADEFLESKWADQTDGKLDGKDGARAERIAELIRNG